MAIDRMLPGNFNRAELDALMNTPAKKKLPGNLNEAEIKLLSDNAAIKESIFEELMEYPEIRELPIEDIIKKVNEIFEQRAIDVSQAPAGNLNKSETNLLMGLIDKGVKDTKREGIMTAAREDGDFDYLLEQLKNLNPSDDNYGVDQEILLQDIRRLEELNPTVSIRPKTDYTYADGGIVHLAPGGSVRTPSTYESKAFEEYIAELGPEFQKKDPDTGKIRGSKGLWNKFVLTKGIKPSSTAATELLNDMRKAKGLSPYISTDMALKGYGKDAVEIATGTKTGQVGAADRDAFYKKSKTIFKDADNMEFKSKDDKYKFIEKQLVKAYPTLAGTGALATFISNRALGAASFFTPSDLEAQTMYSPEEMEKFFAERKIKEKFK